MNPTSRIQRFTPVDRVFHLFVMVTFMIQALTGVGRLLYITRWGKGMLRVFGGYESATTIHKWNGILMLIGFVVHIIYVLTKVDWKAFPKSLFNEDSLVPNLTDLRQIGQRLRWFVGLGPSPKVDRWGYWEKFDYWAVFWGMPLFAITGLMLMYPLEASRLLPGWTINIAVLLHRAEAILAIGYLFIVHFLVGHFRRETFPMNEAMFSGSVILEKEMEEKAAWVERLRQEGRLEQLAAAPPAPWYRVAYFIFGYLVVGVGVYLLFNLFIYRSYVEWH